MKKNNTKKYTKQIWPYLVPVFSGIFLCMVYILYTTFWIYAGIPAMGRVVSLSDEQKLRLNNFGPTMETINFTVLSIPVDPVGAELTSTPTTFQK